MKAASYRDSILKDTMSPIAQEAYKNIRTNLMFLLSNKKYKSILFSSSSPSEGKTTICTNISISLAQTGKRVLIIDADIRNPMVGKLFKLGQTLGLSDVLAGFSDLSCIKATDYENLSLMTAGTMSPNPTELLVSEKFSQIIRELSGRFDYICIDTPPVNLFTDAISIANQVDGVVIIAQYDKTKRDVLKIAVDKFRKVNANILGVVINGMKTKKYFEQIGSMSKGRCFQYYGRK